MASVLSTTKKETSAPTSLPISSTGLLTAAPTPAQVTEKLDRLRARLNDTNANLTKEELLLIVSELQPIYTKLIMADLDSATKRQLENYMWNDCFKTPLTRFMRTDRVMFTMIIETGIGFYLGLIQDLGVHFDVSFIKNSVKSMYCTRPRIKEVVKCTPSKAIVYYLIQNSLVHIGDLLRYGGMLLEASKMYDKSTSLCPSNGHPYNQLGLVQSLLDSSSFDSLLGSVYYYIRALCVTTPFVLAKQNLDPLLRKVIAITPTTDDDKFISAFLVGIQNTDDIEKLTHSLEESIVALVPTEIITFKQLIRMLVIAIWFWKQSEHPLSPDTKAANNASEIIASLINGACTVGLSRKAMPRPAYMCITFLNIALEFIRLNYNIIYIEKFRNRLNSNELCDFINAILLLEADFKDDQSEFELTNVILYEEKKLLGFTPVSAAYERMTSVMDENEPRANGVRVIRFVNTAKVIANLLPSFLTLDATGKFEPVHFSQYYPYASGQGPSRSGHRNIALESLLGSFNISESVSTSEQVQSRAISSLSEFTPNSFISNSATTVCSNAPNTASDKKINYFAETVSPYGTSEGGLSLGIPSSDCLQQHATSTTTISPTISNEFASGPPVQIDTTNLSHIFYSIWTPQPDSQHEPQPGSSKAAGIAPVAWQRF